MISVNIGEKCAFSMGDLTQLGVLRLFHILLRGVASW
jgi:hypothetical protein